MKWSLTKGAQEFGCEPKTLRAALEREGIKVERGNRYSTQDICRAIYDEQKIEKILETRARRIEIEHRNALFEKENLNFAKANALFGAIAKVISKRIQALPAEAAAASNPSDPELATEVLEEWCDQTLKLVKQELPKPKL